MPAVDLHVHSEHSDKPHSWFLRSGKAAECYTAVDEVYALAKRRGMDLVTLADHDTIDGALELCARHPGDTFASVEVSARFPEDGCIVHVICIDIDETRHAELQRLRRNIYELAAYIESEQIAHFWCHPLSQVNGRLRTKHLERCFLMFRALEVRNGTRDVAHEKQLLAISRRLTHATLENWASDHPMAPYVNRVARWALVGGSDDHGSLAIARAHTTFEGPASKAALVHALRNYATAPGGESGTGTTLAHNCYGVLAGYMHAAGDNVLDGVAGVEALTGLIERRSRITSNQPDVIWERGHTTLVQEMMRQRIEPALVESWRTKLDRLFNAAFDGKVGAAADAVPSVLKALAFELPYVLAYRYHARDRRGANNFAVELGEQRAPHDKEPRVAVFTDTIDHVNGVSIGLRRLLGEARRGKRPFHLIAAGSGNQLTVDGEGIVRVPSIFDHRLKEYPEIVWSIPHLPPILRYLTDNSIELVQCSTPGPVGVAGLIAGRLTGARVIGQYHTDVPEYALHLTGDPAAASVVRELVGMFYRALDKVLVPSAHAGGIVRDLGVEPDAIIQVRRGIDVSMLSPARASKTAFAEWGIDGPVVLYVGRVSKEKGLNRLFTAFYRLLALVPNATLVIVGDGPARRDLEAAAPPRTVFTGTVTGKDLATLYASASVFALPSETETFGNVVLEAQASGLPAIVAARSAASELIIDAGTGYAVDMHDPDAVCDAIAGLLLDPARRGFMSRAAARHGASHDIASALATTFECYASILGATDEEPVERGLVA